MLALALSLFLTLGFIYAARSAPQAYFFAAMTFLCAISAAEKLLF